ncbi:MAG TPA: metal ABC transporter ATP-binding protein [Candidatus Acidoferrales bacterium]|nr:metal ABC transporter ATP-binding protein [Candidatus Acidoferrales bacterium]
MTNPLLSVTNLRVAFGSRVVIQDLSFHIDSGDCLAIIGPNGAGKTVLLKALLGLLPHEGTIRWSPDARVGYVPQKVAADWQLPLRVEDLLCAKARTLKLPAREMESVCAQVGLGPEVLNATIGSLSGGQFQKALIAFALVGSPNVLLFDEPTASLDELTEDRVYDLVHSLQQEKGITVLLVSHDLSVVYRYATKVLCVSKDVECMGAPQEILTPERLEQLYAAPPKYYRHVEGHQHGEL